MAKDKSREWNALKRRVARALKQRRFIFTERSGTPMPIVWQEAVLAAHERGALVPAPDEMDKAMESVVDRWRWIEAAGSVSLFGTNTEALTERLADECVAYLERVEAEIQEQAEGELRCELRGRGADEQIFFTRKLKKVRAKTYHFGA